ncbi:MAG: alanine racemase [Eubacteriales bacterium]|nr:alanine racemase [Eubacteriales bacterium]
MDYKFNRAWAEIDLDNIAHNVREIRRITDKKSEIMGVVKADAYGHGVMEVAKTLLENGVSSLAVSMLDEAIQLRNNGITAPILILSYTDPVRADEIIRHHVTQTVFSHDLAEALSDAAVKAGAQVKIHIKVDTGMTRVGFMSGYSAVKNIERISRLPGIIIEGLFTHFATADEKDKTYTHEQFSKFMSIWSELNRIGILIPVKHCANSAAITDLPDMHLDLVRPGIILYGLYPSKEVDHGIMKLKPAMTLKADIILVKNVEDGIPVSYGGDYVTKGERRIATIPVGYADGYSRLLSDRGKVLINGEYAPIVGRVCMDQTMVDVTDLKSGAAVGDEVVLIGTQGGKAISAEDVAEWAETINYEVVSLIGKRIPRFYIKNGRYTDVLNYLI